MNDLLLWRLLQQNEPDPVQLVPLLAQLRERPVEQRVPYLGLLPRCLEHSDAALRAAAVGCLADVSGWLGYRQIVHALRDPEESVRVAAVEALRAAARHDGYRWAHALFHLDPLVRRRALAEKTQPLAVRYLLYLLPDAESAPRVRELMNENGASIHQLPLLLDYWRQGLTPAQEVRGWLAGVSWQDGFQLLHQGAQRSIGQATVLLERASKATQPAEVLAGEVGEDVLDELFALYWEDFPHPGGSKSPESERFFANLRNFLRSHAGLDSRRVLAALLVLAARKGHWLASAAETCVAFHPQFLDFAWVTRAVRRAAVSVLYGEGRQLPMRSESEVRPLLDLALCRRASGSLDLYVVGGLLHYIKSTPLKQLFAWMGENAILGAFLEDMEDSAPLLSLQDNSEKGVGHLLALIGKSRRPKAAQMTALMVQARPADQLGFLDALAGVDALAVFSQLLQTTNRPGLSLSENKLSKVAAHLGNRLIPDTLLAFFKILLDLPQPEECRLGQLILAHVASTIPVEQLWAFFQKGDLDRLKRFLKLMVWTPGFPFTVEAHIARILRTHPDEEVRAWAVERLPSESVLTPTNRRTTSRDAVKLTASQSKRLKTCDNADLPAALEDWLGQPCRELCPALAARAPLHSLEACAALLGCHDKLDEVAEQFQRYCSVQPEFLERLEQLVVRVWRGNKGLPLLGRAWLYRWDEHGLTLPDVFPKMPADLLKTMRLAGSFKSRTLVLRLWQAFENLVAWWRWNDRQKMQQLYCDGTGTLLLGELPGPVGVQAARVAIRLRDFDPGSALVAAWKTEVMGLLPDLVEPVRRVLQDWIDARGVAAPAAPRPAASQPLDSDQRKRIHKLSNLDELEQLCAHEDRAIAEEAGLRLTDLSEAGRERLLRVLGQVPPVPAAIALAELVSLWPKGKARRGLPGLFHQTSLPSQLRFIIGLELLRKKEVSAAAVLQTVVEPAETLWFRLEHWRHLRDAGVAESDIALSLALAPHPHAYTQAVQQLVTGQHGHGESVVNALRGFLESGTGRPTDLRVEATRWLFQHGDRCGFPLLLLEACKPDSGLQVLLKEAPAWEIEATVQGILTVGTQFVNEHVLFGLVSQPLHDVVAQHEAYQRMLTDCVLPDARARVAAEVGRGAQYAQKLRRVAETFAWGVRIGRSLTGRVFAVEMITGEGLGYTRFEEDKLYISPLPLLRGDRHGQEVVEGLLLHEMGHHLYHRGPEKQVVWNDANKERLHPLLNLVSDEHLERNLRALDEDHGDRLKKLCSYAFQHTAKEILVDELLRILQSRSFTVLSAARLEVARTPRCVLVDSGRVLIEMEKAGLSFARFMRALRMGLGNRHHDPRVAAGLALFRKDFRQSTMPQMLEMARQLREIFGWETELLQCLGQDPLLHPAESEMLKHGEGIKNDAVKREVERILDPKRQKHQEGKQEEPLDRLWLNINPDEQFEQITRIQPMLHNPADHAKYAQQVARHARSLRRFLESLGVRLEPQRQRLRGKMLDRTRLRALVEKGDPRILIAREIQVQTDLFLGVVIDCSGSMATDQNIEKAKLFGTLIAEAVRGVPGIDARLLGFTHDTIFDCGNAQRCGVHGLYSTGGNNDAAGLWHLAQLARASKRRAKVLVMISDGLPTECSVAALKGLVKRLSGRFRMCCAQVAVRPLEEICFPHYILLEEQDRDRSVRQFGLIVAKLVRKTLRGG